MRERTEKLKPFLIKRKMTRQFGDASFLKDFLFSFKNKNLIKKFKNNNFLPLDKSSKVILTVEFIHNF